jgi:hypothetical protein
MHRGQSTFLVVYMRTTHSQNFDSGGIGVAGCGVQSLLLLGRAQRGSMGDFPVCELVVVNRERGVGGPILATEGVDWEKFGADFEQCVPTTPEEKSWPKRIRRFQRSIDFKRKHRVERSCVSCLEIDQDLFHEFAPPSGPVQVNLEELISITAAKRLPPRLANRRIQVTGRRMERFVPPVWKPRVTEKRNLLMEFRRSSVKEETKEREIKKESKADTRPAVRRSTRKVRHLVAVDEGVEMEFLVQLWDSPTHVESIEKGGLSALVWVKKELVETRNFAEGDCFPFRHGDTPSEVKRIRVSADGWPGGKDLQWPD